MSEAFLLTRKAKSAQLKESTTVKASASVGVDPEGNEWGDISFSPSDVLVSLGTRDYIQIRADEYYDPHNDEYYPAQVFTLTEKSPVTLCFNNIQGSEGGTMVITVHVHYFDTDGAVGITGEVEAWDGTRYGYDNICEFNIYVEVYTRQ